jgi:hypothetical protein
MHNAPAATSRSTHPSGTSSRTSACTLALLQSPLFVDHQAMDQLSGRDLGDQAGGQQRLGGMRNPMESRSS